MAEYPRVDALDPGGDSSLIKGDFRGDRLKIGIIVSRYNPEITSRLLRGAQEALSAAGVGDDQVKVVSVPGAFEIPGVAKRLASSGGVDAIVCLGAVVRGETEHFTYVSKAVQEGVLAVSLETGVPITFGVLTTEDVDQALARTGGELGDKGYEAAHDAVEMANTYRLIE